MANAFQKAVADEALLRASLAEANFQAAMLVLGHLGGESELPLLEQAAAHIEGAWPWMEKIPADLKQTIRERLIAVLKDHAARELTPPEPQPASMLRAINATVGAQVPEEYLPLLAEEAGMGVEDRRALQWRKEASSIRRDRLKIVIVGAGLSGIIAAIRLKQAGIPFVILEKNAGVGGTWWENDYPGLRVDTASYFYSMSFNPYNRWSHYFAKREEIFRYIDDTVESYGLREHIRFNIEVTEMSYREDSQDWRLTCRHEDGRTEALDFNIVISAVGLINRPSVPDIEGMERFKGPKVHTAAWDKSVDFKDRRVGLIGTGASGMQVGPSLAPEVAKLSIFQRTPHWAAHNPLYHQAVPEGQKWCMDNIPFYSQWQRFLFFWGASDGLHKGLHADPGWTQPELSMSEANHKVRETIIAHIRKELDGDEKLLAKCVPDYPPYGKRMLRDNHWYRMLKRPNVDLVTDGISHITEHAVVTRDGQGGETEHVVDALVFATGFVAGKMLWPMTVRGRGGVTIRDIWGDDDPRAYKGITVPGFPNLFLTSGPNTGLAHGGSHIFHSECEITYIMGALREMLEEGYTSVEVRREAHDWYNDEVARRHSQLVWAHPRVKSWYKNSKGRVTIISPWRLLDYWGLTRNFDPGQYDCLGGSEKRRRQAV